jgi:hypothetical protein
MMRKFSLTKNPFPFFNAAPLRISYGSSSHATIFTSSQAWNIPEYAFRQDCILRGVILLSRNDLFRHYFFFTSIYFMSRPISSTCRVYQVFCLRLWHDKSVRGFKYADVDGRYPIVYMRRTVVLGWCKCILLVFLQPLPK